MAAPAGRGLPGTARRTLGEPRPLLRRAAGERTVQEAHAPEAVLHVGGRAVSSRLEQFLAGSRPDPYVVVRENPFRLDPGHRVTHSVEADVLAFCAALTQAAERRPPAAAASWT